MQKRKAGQPHKGWKAAAAKAKRRDWTTDPKTGISNSSPLFEQLCDEVARLIRSDAHCLLAGNTKSTGRLIMAQLAHVYGLGPAR